MDFTRYNLEGSPVTVGSNPYKSSLYIKYYIKQNMRFSRFSVGFSAAYTFKLNRFRVDIGPGIYFLTHASWIISENRYVGEQPVNPPPYTQLPAEKSVGSYSDDKPIYNLIPYVGFNFQAGYAINKRLVAKLFSSFFYDHDSRIRPITTDYSGAGKLPNGNIYTIEKQYWLVSGVALRINF